MKNKFLQKDKILHILSCVMIVFIFGILFNILVGVISAIIASLAKEAFDEYTYGGWDNKDLLADCIGIVIGVILLSL